MSFLSISSSAALTVFLAGAAPDPAPEPAPANLLRNPGFEDGREGWKSLGGPHWGEFEVVEDVARGGRRSARLSVDWPSGSPGPATRVFGVVQEPELARMPDRLSGWYRVDDWWSESAETSLYLQAVVIVFGDPETASVLGGSDRARRVNNYQLRYYLAGASEPAFLLSNARIRFVSREPPRRGEWVRFELPIAEDFRESWGRVPEGFEGLRVLFEARWDGRPEGAGVRGEVHYDDLSLEFAEPPKAPNSLR